MGVMILFMVLIVVCLALVIYGRNGYSDIADLALPIGVIGGAVCTLIFFLILLDAATLPNQFAQIRSEYDNLKEQLADTEKDDIVTRENLRNQVLEMNNKIAEHRNFCHNGWVGMWYSEEIGNLEKLKWSAKSADVHNK